MCMTGAQLSITTQVLNSLHNPTHISMQKACSRNTVHCTAQRRMFDFDAEVETEQLQLQQLDSVVSVRARDPRDLLPQ